MIIPHQELSEDALSGLIADWLSRQSQELLSVSKNQADLIDDVKRQLIGNHIVLTWDDESQTVNIMDRQSAEQSVHLWSESGNLT